MATILVVDDERSLRSTLTTILRQAGHLVHEASNGEEACQRVTEENYDLVLTDLRMKPSDGMTVLRHIKEASSLTEVMVMTAFGTIESAVEAMKMGAHDYIQKPFTEQELLVKVQKALEKRRLAAEVSTLAAEFRERYHFENIIGRSGAIRDVLARIVRIAPADSPVLITGESGTGKELVARAIHSNSRRADRPFVCVNCAAITETLLESELFGHVRGAFTGAVNSRKGLFEEASGGTFFFDEIGETPPSFQVKLLRAIQEGEIRKVGDSQPIKVDIRVISATNQDLQLAIEERRFRKDLYYRLNVIRFVLPPLRTRKEDIPMLVDYFLEECSRKLHRRCTLGKGVLEYLLNQNYPGNVRELENLIEQGVALAPEGSVRLADIQPMEGYAVPPLDSIPLENLQDEVDRAEKAAIERVLRKVDGNRERAASLLGLSPTTLWRKMKRLNVV